MDLRIVPLTDEHRAGFQEVLDINSRGKIYEIVKADEQKRPDLSRIETVPPEQKFAVDPAGLTPHQFAALSQDKVVGWCRIIPDSTRTVRCHKGTLDIAVLPEFQGKGLGTQLMRRTINAAFEYGLARIELTVREPNKTAVGLYEKMGFEIEEKRENAVRRDGKYENTYLMALNRA